ncbi:MAG: CHAT domain-containing protein [Ahniella sp.]|nr:CHAT domain-containing protein [Ahniella sp.]
MASISEPSELERIDDEWHQAIADKRFDRALALQTRARETAKPEQMPLVWLRSVQMHHRARDWSACRKEASNARAAINLTMLRIRLSETENHCASFAGDWKDAQKIQQERLAELDQLAPNSLIHARFAANLAQIESFSDGLAALVRMERAVAQALAACGRCRDFGVITNFHGDVLSNLNRYAESEAAYREGVTLARAFKDDPAALAARLRPMARSLRLLGRLDEAEAALKEALQLVRDANRPPADQGAYINGLGVIAAFRGDFRSAARWFREALSLYPPGAETVDMANARANLGWVWMQSGDLASAEQELRAATAIISKNDQGVNQAVFLTNLADAVSARGDFEEALSLMRQAIALNEKVNAESHDLAGYLIKAAILLEQLQQMDESRALWTRAFVILEKLPADNFLLADPLNERGHFELARGEPALAAASFERALDLYRTQSSESLAMSRALHGAGLAAMARARLPEARQLLEGALAIRVRDVPNTGQHAEVLHALGRLAQRERDPAKARTLFCQASDMLDDASLRVGGDAFGQARFRSLFAQIYRDCVIANVELGASVAALEALERGRARGFRAALELRQLQLANPEERKALDALAVNLAGEQEALARANDAKLDAGQRQVARTQVQDLRKSRADLRARFERLLPSLSPKSLKQLQERLAPNEAYLAFAIAEDRSAALFLRADGEVRSVLLPISGLAVGNQVRDLRAALLKADSSLAWQQASDALRRQLLGGLSEHLDGVDTLLLSPDGALHNLPFAALWNAETNEYWIDRFGIGIVDSLSSRSLPEARAGSQTLRLLAVGDPLGSAASKPDAALQSELRRNGAGELSPLPAARREVEQLADRYANQVQVLLGDQASEQRVRALAPSANQLHFAVHALLDPQRVLDSSLVLHPGTTGQSRDDGFLRVHEILSDLDLDTDLVVLSACDTGLGKELAGEGLVGFSRAFAFAGAKATLASLWPVADESTADLMNRFYAARDQGLGASQSLRRAMIGLTTAPSSNLGDQDARRGVGGLAPSDAGNQGKERLHPYYWAAFQVYGE